MCRKGQHWLGLEKLLTNSFEPINGSCNGIGPVERLEVAKLRMFVCFGDFFLSEKSFPKIGAPLRVLGVPLAPLSLLAMQIYTTNFVLSYTL